MARQNHEMALRCLLFAAGLAVLLVALALLAPYSLGGIEARVFTVVVSVSLYVVLFGPLVLGGTLEGMRVGEIVAGGMYAKAATIYAACSVGTMTYVNLTLQPPLGLLIVVQLVALLAIGAYIVMGDATQTQVFSVEANEQAKVAPVKAMRANAARLEALALDLDPTTSPDCTDVQRRMRRIADDVRYLSPSGNSQATQLDVRIDTNLRAMNTLLDTSAQDVRIVEELGGMTRETQRLIDQRKKLCE